jgi:hypothetical protein
LHPNYEVVLVEEPPLFSVEERAALAGFLAGYAGLTRDAYTLDLRHTRRGGSGTACLCSPPAGADIECFAAAVRGSTGLAPGGVQMSSPGGANRAESIAQLSRRVESGSGRVSCWPPRMESFKTPEANCG